MKKIIVILFVLVGFNSGFSQTVNDVPIDSLDVEYVQIMGTQKLLSKKVTIQIDFGQHDKIWVAKDTQVKDSTGRLVVFNSMVDAMNFMSSIGYDFQAAYTITIGSQNVYHFLLQRRNQ
jgi:hypothetical protein